ncbi:MAG: hypothetical protein HQ510_01205 [Candidatus Marinimicrobia bacterium]|nr:hypothetical protein [Candidatus Neomarinimicrobiota bacterium]
MEIITDIIYGDYTEELKLLDENSIDLIIISLPNADQQKNTYGGARSDKYDESITSELL